jgi:hypothetical protein
MTQLDPIPTGTPGRGRFKHGYCFRGRIRREYASYHQMIRRCYEPKHNRFHRYGGRGITVCDRWRYSFQNFIADMGQCPVGLSLERVDKDGNYEPGNCKWATRIEQANNRHTNRLISYNGKMQSLAMICRECGVRYGRIVQRLKRGWSIEKSLLIP